jgi:hypothetical protein
MMTGIRMSFMDAEATWRHHTVGSYATFVIAVATTAEVVVSTIVRVICGHIGLGSILTTLANSAGAFAFAFASAALGL